MVTDVRNTAVAVSEAYGRRVLVAHAGIAIISGRTVSIALPRKTTSSKSEVEVGIIRRAVHDLTGVILVPLWYPVEFFLFLSFRNRLK